MILYFSNLNICTGCLLSMKVQIRVAQWLYYNHQVSNLELNLSHTI